MSDHTAVIAWLMITGLASLTQTVFIIWLVISADRRWRQSGSALKALERDHLAPLLSHLDLALTDLHDLATRARRVEEDARLGWTRAANAVTETARHAQAAAWPVWGMLRGVRAALSVLRAQRPTGRTRRRDEDAISRFVYEGGNAHVRN